jgi:predicted O-methyltransferase YrrM
MFLLIAERIMHPLRWTTDNELLVDDLVFVLDSPESRRMEASGNRFPMLKNRRFLERLIRTIGSSPIHHILEFGMFEGGSALLLQKLYSPTRVVSIDIKPAPRSALFDYISKRDLGDVIRPYTKTDQADRTTIERLINDDLNGIIIWSLTMRRTCTF